MACNSDGCVSSLPWNGTISEIKLPTISGSGNHLPITPFALAPRTLDVLTQFPEIPVIVATHFGLKPPTRDEEADTGFGAWYADSTGWGARLRSDRETVHLSLLRRLKAGKAYPIFIVTGTDLGSVVYITPDRMALRYDPVNPVTRWSRHLDAALHRFLTDLVPTIDYIPHRLDERWLRKSDSAELCGKYLLAREQGLTHLQAIST